MSKLIAVIPYEELCAGILREEEYHYPKLKNVKVAGIVTDPVPDKEGCVTVLFPEDFGGKISMDSDALEFIVLPDNV